MDDGRTQYTDDGTAQGGVVRNEIEAAIFAALMHHKPDYRSPKRLNEAAHIITDFIMGALVKE